jgi:hypothetical protein
MRTFRNATRELDNDTFGRDLWVRKPYKPNLRLQAARISKEEWLKHEARIRELHAEGYTSERARQILRNESSFNPSASQYTAQLKALGLRTYSTKARYAGPRLIGFTNEWRCEDVAGELRLEDGQSTLIREALGRIPEGRDLSDTSSTSATDSARSPNSTLRTEISDDEQSTPDQTSREAGSGEAGPSDDTPFPAAGHSTLTCTTQTTFDDTYVLEDGGPLLTFLKVVDPGFAYEPASPLLRFWPQFADKSVHVTWSMLDEISTMASYLHAARSDADAFDLYYMVFCHLHKTMDTYIRRHLLTAVLNCAKTSATEQQDACAVAVLRLALRDQERGSGDHVSAGVLHLYLGELYKKQKNERSEASTVTAIQYLAEACGGEDKQDPYFSPVRARTVRELDLPDRLRTLLILHKKTIPPAYTRYFSSDSDTPAFQVARDIKSYLLVKHLLVWCADVISHKARNLNHLTSALVGDSTCARGCLARMLFCCCLELWLKGQTHASGGETYFSQAQSAIKEANLPFRASLSAVSCLIVDEAFRNSDPRATIKKRFSTKTLASHLARTVKAMLGRMSETEESYTDTLLAFMVASGNEATSSQVDELSRKILDTFTSNLVSSGMLGEQQPHSPTAAEWKELTPVAADFRGHVISQCSWSRTLYPPRSSFSSGARSLRALHAEREQISLRPLSTSRSRGSLAPAWSLSRRRSWGFEHVTGLTHDSSLRGRGNTSVEPGISVASLADTIMVDV